MREITQKFLSRLQRRYIKLHKKKEDLFWRSYMALSATPEAVQTAYAQAEIKLNVFRQNAKTLRKLRALKQQELKAGTPESDLLALNGWLRMFEINAIDNPDALALSAEIVAFETALTDKSRQMKTGYIDPSTGEFQALSYKGLMLMMDSDDDSARRAAAYEGIVAIGRFRLDNGFLDLVKMRNHLARMLGYEDHFDMRVQMLEGISKQKLFEMIDKIVAALLPRAKAEVEAVVAEHGPTAREPQNFSKLTKGKLTAMIDPYYPLSTAVERWGQTFEGLGIRYNGAKLTLDLVERPGKYPNGFMHGPGLMVRDESGAFTAAKINFTCNACPGKIGSGIDVLFTLLHEGGHAAHFANILTGYACHSHEFPPTSVGYAEMQSMFMDALATDPIWRALYARDKDGVSMPHDLIILALREELRVRATRVLSLLITPLGERMLYSMPEDELTPDNVFARMQELEERCSGLTRALRPVLAMPHIVPGESSCYYQGYTLARIGVLQARAHFLAKYGSIVNNPRIGQDLAECCWAPGNSIGYSDIVERLTGAKLSPDALIEEYTLDPETVCEQARRDLSRLQQDIGPTPELDRVNLDGVITIMHGNEQICSTADGTFLSLARAFERWINTLEKQDAA